MKALLRFNLTNELKNADYVGLIEFLNENISASVVLFPGVDLEFIIVSPITVTVKGLSYKINTEILFENPIGFEVFDNLKLDVETREDLEVNRRNFKLSKIVTGQADLEKGLNIICRQNASKKHRNNPKDLRSPCCHNMADLWTLKLL